MKSVDQPIVELYQIILYNYQHALIHKSKYGLLLIKSALL